MKEFVLSPKDQNINILTLLNDLAIVTFQLPTQ